MLFFKHMYLLVSRTYNECLIIINIISRRQVERIKLSRKVLYHFAIFAMVNEILATKDCK